MPITPQEAGRDLAGAILDKTHAVARDLLLTPNVRPAQSLLGGLADAVAAAERLAGTGIRGAALSEVYERTTHLVRTLQTLHGPQAVEVRTEPCSREHVS